MRRSLRAASVGRACSDSDERDAIPTIRRRRRPPGRSDVAASPVTGVERGGTSVVSGLFLSSVGLLPADVDDHRSHLADREGDLDPDLADRLRFAWTTPIAAERSEERFQALDLV